VRWWCGVLVEVRCVSVIERLVDITAMQVSRKGTRPEVLSLLKRGITNTFEDEAREEFLSSSSTSSFSFDGKVKPGLKADPTNGKDQIPICRPKWREIRDISEY
jgi:hypothetical protein